MIEPNARSSWSTVLLSYDVDGRARSLSVRVAQLIFGRSDAGRRAPKPFIQRPGVLWMGQSVFLMPPPVAEDLARRLQAMGVTVITARISISRHDLDGLRRRRRDRLSLAC